MIWVCPVVELVKSDFNVITEYTVEKNRDQIDEIVNMILNYYIGDADYVDVVKIARAMGFSIYSSQFREENVEGFISINDENIDKFKNKKIIKLNKKENMFKKRFIIAHELGHYLFEFNDFSLESNNKFLNASFKSTPPVEKEEIIKENRASYFAACLLMPKDAFLKKYREFSKNFKNYDLILKLSTYFEVPVKSVEIRFKELNLKIIQ